MKRLRNYEHRVYKTPGGPRLMGYARAQLVPNGPEEYVRQDVLRSLVEEYGYPAASLLSEEPVARGTKNRRRADVLVELPRRLARRHEVEVVAPEGEGGQVVFRSYGELMAGLRETFGEHTDALEPLDLPDVYTLHVDGDDVSCRVLGFCGGAFSLQLWLEPQPQRDDLPPYLPLNVMGYGRSRLERRVAEDLGLPNVEYRDPQLASFQDGVMALTWVDPNPAYGPTGTIADDDDVGFVTLAPVGQAPGVLCRVDLRTQRWLALVLSLLQDATRARWSDGRTLHRYDLDELAPDDRVCVVDEHIVASDGRIVSTAEAHVVVDVGGDEVKVARKASPGDAFLLGRLDPPPEPQALTRDGDMVEGATKTFIVVECKAPSVTLTAEVERQGLDYARARRATYLVLTNGTHARTHLIRDGKVTPVEDLPTHAEAVTDETYQVAEAVEFHVDRVALPDDAAVRPDHVSLLARSRSRFGSAAPESHWLPMLVLDDLLHADELGFEPTDKRYGVALAEDLGLRWHEPGTPSGGSYPGEYRDFLIRDGRRREVIFGMKINDYGTTVNDKGKRRGGGTILSCCLSFGAVYHPVLQCRLDRFLEAEEDRLRLWHSGRATVGKGSVKNERVIRFVGKHQPDLVHDGAIALGTVPFRPGLRWPDAHDLVHRLAGYVMLRHRFKEATRKTRRR